MMQADNKPSSIGQRILAGAQRTVQPTAPVQANPRGLPQPVDMSAAIHRPSLITAKPGPYRTDLSPDQEQKFQQWVKSSHIPFDLKEATPDYDMRGYWKAQQSGDPNAVRAATNQHFPDTWKTPYHKTFSNESIYATEQAPHWEDDRLIDRNGRVVADESAPPAQMKRDQP